MSFWLPASLESRWERRLVGAGTVLLHILLVWLLLRVAGVGIAGEGATNASQGTGVAMVVEFIALPAKKNISLVEPIQIEQEPSPSEGKDAVTRPDLPTAESDPTIDRALSDIGEVVDEVTRSIAQSSSAGAATSASQGGAPADDLLANYHGALRATIRRKWQTLTNRPFPSGCTVRLDLAVGGPVNSVTASGCDISQADRMQLESAILMAQPLPYAGFESVFTAALPLTL